MAEAKMKQPSVQLGPMTPIDEKKPLSHKQQEIETAGPSVAKSGPNLAEKFLLQGSRDEYLRLGVPLYEASIKCDWKAAEEILTRKENLELGLVRCSITENGETALHVAASAKVPGKVEEFVKNLVNLMKKEDLELENENYNTALYLAAAAGNIETVKIMMEVNEKLLSIPGGGSQYSKPQMMPMYTAALFGNHEVVKYMYEKSNDLIEGGWTPATRAWLLEKCVDNNMFDIAIKIVKRYPKLGITGTVLGILARKPEAFVEPDFNIIQATISWGQHQCKHLFSKMSISDRLPNKKLSEHGKGKVHGNFARKAEKTFSDIGKTIESGKRLYFSSIIGRTINYTRRPIKYVFKIISSKVVPPENKKEALQLLQIIWNNIAKMPKVEIDCIIRGPSESKQVNKPASENVEQAAKLYSERIAKMQFDIQNTIRETPISGKEDQALKLQNLISEQIAKILVENQNVIRAPPTTKKTYYPSRILFVAAEMGNTTFVVELIRQYPDLIWKVNDNGLSIFHIAVKHRHEGIYNLLYEIGSMKDLITPLKDQNGNTMLHLVGKSAKQKRLEDVSGVALQMQRELLWFQMNQSGVIQLGPIDEQTPLSQQQQNITVSVASPRANSGPNLPQLDLLEGPREDYLKIGVPLYEASIKCDWKAAKAILDKHPDMKLLRYSITENAETALHVAASAKGPKHVEDFVKNLVELMEKEDLALENKNCNTALYLAAAAGNIKTVKIMMEKNRTLLTIPGGGSMDKKPQMMPLYTAALFGNHEVVKYMYEESKDLIDDGWTDANRGWLLEKCVENDMFDIALKIVDKYKKLASNGGLLGVLARKPEAFSVKQHNFIWRFIIWVFSLIGITVGAYEKECKALQLLKIIWGEIAKNNKNEIDRIIRGPADTIKSDNTSASKRVIQAMQLENLISEHVSKMKDETQNIMEGHPDSTNQDPKQHKVDQALKLQQLISKQLVNMHAETQKITKEEAKQISAKVDQVSELEKLISKHILDMHTETHNIIRGPSAFGQEDQAQHLQNLISTHIAKLLVKTKSITDTAPAVPAAKSTYSNRVVFVATEMGNTKFLVELIRLYPDLIWKINDDGLSVFHIAVKHRHEGIYNLLYEIGAMKDLITPLRDEHENNMLHLVGKIAKQKRLEDVSGFALQMQRELLWFQEVRNMIPPSYRERKNKDDLTPHELFTKEHKDLVKRGEEWMKGTASQCMVVAALIATIVFAAAFTIPGGYAQSNDQASKQKNGVPVFHSKATFMVFVVADAISLFSSSASILMFLSILTSRYAERDFLESLPKKLMLGLATLFLSITTMTVAFSVSFFVLYHKGLLWIPILIGALALLPVLLYIKLQYGLFVDVIRSTYGSRYLFKPRKHVLYYKNPEV